MKARLAGQRLAIFGCLMHESTYLTAALILAGLAISDSSLAETLDEALVSAYGSNPTLLAERARLRATDEAVPQALANWRPTVSFATAANRTNVFENLSNGAAPVLPGQPKVTTSGTSFSSPVNLSLGINQPLYRGGRTVAQTEQAEAQVAAERAALDATEETVLLDAVTAYMDVVKGKAVLDLSINNEQVLQRQLDATNDRFRVGEVTRTDVAEAESRRSAARADRIQAEGNLQAATASYLTTVGHLPENVGAPKVPTDLPASLGQAHEQALHNNPNVKNARFSFEAASHAVDLVAGEILPTVSLNGTLTRNYDFNGPDSYERVAQATLNLTVPIYQQGQEYSRVRQQKHAAGEAHVRTDVTSHATVEQVTQTWEALKTAQARSASYADQIKAAEVALEGVQRESQVGSRTVLDVLNAEQELLTARVNLVQAQHDVVVDSYRLKSTIGQLTAKALALPVAIYDPLEHYEAVRDKWIGTGIEPAYGDAVK